MPAGAAVRARRTVAGAARRSSASCLALEPADEALGPFVARAPRTRSRSPCRRAGPVFASLDDLPAMPLDGVVLANELLDNLPFGIARVGRHALARSARRRRRRRASSRCSCPRPRSTSPRWHESSTAAPSGRRRAPDPARPRASWFDECAARAAPRCRGAGRLHRSTSTSCSRAAPTGCAPTEHTGAAATRSTTRAAGHHRRRRARATRARRARRRASRIAGDQTQAEWLRDLGIDDLVAEGRRAWDDGARARRPRCARRPQPRQRRPRRSPTRPASAPIASSR